MYVAIDPSDRGGGWRVALEDALRPILERADGAPHEEKVTLRAVVDAISRRFLGNGAAAGGRGHVGFVEVAGKGGREEWQSYRIPPRQTEAVYGHRPYLRPLIEILERGARIGVAAASGDQLRLWEWELGVLEEREHVTLTVSGESDELHHRIGDHRERFVKQAAARTESEAAARGWRELLVFGEVEHVSNLAEALRGREPHHVLAKNVVAEPAARIAERVESELPGLLRERELGLIRTTKEAAFSGKERASLGPQETLEALVAARVEHLVFDAERDYKGHGVEQGLAYDGPPLGEHGLPVTELMIERAVATGARITPVVGEAAAALDEHDGVVALLRY